MSNPNYSFLNLIHALHAVLNDTAGEISRRERQLLRLIDPKEKFIFVLADGLGSHFINRLKPSAFLRKRKALDMTSVFPSTTACAVLTAASGRSPAGHGVPGRWTYAEKTNTHIDTLAFRERFTGNEVTEGVTVRHIWRYPSLLRCPPGYGNEENRGCLWVIPNALRDSPFETYLCGDCEKFGYTSISEAVDETLRFIKTDVKAKCPGRTALLYLWDFDSLLHEEGTEGGHVNVLLQEINDELYRLTADAGPNVRVCITADHGQLNAPLERRLPIYPGDELLDLLETPPFGEPRVPQFIVRKDKVKPFLALVKERYSEYFTFHMTETLRTDDMFGRGAPDVSFFGTIAGIARHDATLKYYHEGTSPEQDHLGEHGGMTAQERTIPLIE